MKKFLLAFLVSTIYAHAAGDAPPPADSAIHTFGGGALLESAMTAIGKILYGKGAGGAQTTFNLFLRLSLTIGAFCCVCMAFFRQKFEPIFKSFFLPGVAIVGLLLAPTTTVAIIDHHAEKPTHKVIEQKVPFFLGKFAIYSSEAVYRLKELFSEATGQTTAYSWTKNFGAQSPFTGTDLPIREVEENFKEFCRECVHRDLGLGLYSREELRTQADLVDFFKEKTSKTRTVFLRGDDSVWVPCKEAIERIEQNLTDETEDNPLLENPSLKQRIAIHLLKNQSAGDPTFFSNICAGILSLHTFLEALLYLIFPLVILLSLLSFGFRLIVHWARLMLWVLTWPIFYVIVDLFLNSIWKFREGEISDLTLANYDLLASSYSSIEVIALFAVASVPVLSWILIKGGISQVAELVMPSRSLPSEAPKSSEIKEIQKTIVVSEPSPQSFSFLGQENHFNKEIDPHLIRTMQEKIRKSAENELMHSPSHGIWKEK